MENKISGFFKNIKKSIRPNREEQINLMVENLAQDILINPLNGQVLSSKEIAQVVVKLNHKIKTVLQVRKKFHEEEVKEAVEAINII